MPRRDARRDALAEQQLVRDLWPQVEARIDSSGALRAFLTRKIDDCGQTVAFEALDLVRQVLNPAGFTPQGAQVGGSGARSRHHHARKSVDRRRLARDSGTS